MPQSPEMSSPVSCRQSWIVLAAERPGRRSTVCPAIIESQEVRDVDLLDLTVEGKAG